MANLSDISAIGKPLLANLQKLGLQTTQQLLLHLPIRYQDETKITPIRDLHLGQACLVQGEVVHAEISYRPRKALIARLDDGSGQLTVRLLNFYPSQIATLKVGTHLRLYGEIRHGFFGYEMVHPAIKKADLEAVLAEKLTPIYSTVAGLSQGQLRKAIKVTFDYAIQHGELDEILPDSVYQHHDLPELPDFYTSLMQLHAPLPTENLAALENRSAPSWQRLAFDELLAQQLSMRQHYVKRYAEKATIFPPSKELVSQLLKRLPFQLTIAQQKAAIEIQHDLNKPYPMQRLLQGDVGSGKTIVACMAALQCIEQGWQVAMMAPTEILAEQHFRKMTDWLQPLGVEMAWLTGSQTKKSRDAAILKISEGSAQLVIGTHALFQEEVQFKNLGLAIIDEQHRFGVQQRLALRQKSQTHQTTTQCHQLMMSATPIPRTLSMSYYADLDVSIIDALPAGRTPVMTKLVSEKRRDEILARVRNACHDGKQAYWVCPLIEESEALQLATANDTYANMLAIFPELTIGLLHGRMKPSEKQKVMENFSAGDIQLLVATTVIEVGVDVPNASLMIIEHAERMGLSQLHQLRGRVGRGTERSTCILLYQHPLSEIARERLKVIYESNDGFAIAEADLKIRGPGEYLGVRQSGVPMLKIADLERDAHLLPIAKVKADQLLKENKDAVASHLQRWLANSDEFIKV
jgi:ATP-dependent DNA helicase RecG